MPSFYEFRASFYKIYSSFCIGKKTQCSEPGSIVIVCQLFLMLLIQLHLLQILVDEAEMQVSTWHICKC
jgi:hypothetical protein